MKHKDTQPTQHHTDADLVHQVALCVSERDEAESRAESAERRLGVVTGALRSLLDAAETLMSHSSVLSVTELTCEYTALARAGTAAESALIEATKSPPDGNK